MDTAFLYNKSITPPDHDESFLKDIERIVFEKRRNIIIRNCPNFIQILTTSIPVSSDIIIIEIDLYIGEDRSDFVEQIVRTLKSYFHDKTMILHKYELLCNDKITEMQKDDILYSLFDDLTQSNRVILIFEKFDYYALILGNNHYHRLSQLCKKRYFQKLNIVLLINNHLSIQPTSLIMSDFISTFDCSDLCSLSSMPSNNIIYKPIKTKEMSSPEVYISYAWEPESERIVDGICQALDAKSIKYKRDKTDLDYGESIKNFEESLGKGDFIILVVSDKFLRSKNCMYEVLKIKESGNMPLRILPVVLDSAEIRRSQDQIQYIEHWEDEIKILDSAMKRVSSANLGGLRNDIDNFTEFRRIIMDIIGVLSDMNTLNWSTHEESNYAELIKRIEGQMETEASVSKEGNDSEEPKIGSKIVNQYGRNTVYIEKNEGDIHLG